MGLSVRLVFGAAGLVAFTSLTIDDARLLRDRVGLPVSWLVLGTGATVVAGFIHLALTPEHWDEARLYGAFFLMSGVVQLVLASLLIRAGAGAGAAVALVGANLCMIAVYVGTRIVPPFGADLPEALDALGVVSVGAEGVAAMVGLTLARRLATFGAVRAPRGTAPSCPGPRAQVDGSGTRMDR